MDLRENHERGHSSHVLDPFPEKMRMAYILSIILFLSAVCPHPGVVPGRWEKLQAQGPQQEIIVILESGERIEGKLTALEADHLTVSTPSGTRSTLLKSAVRTVLGQKTAHGPVLNGILIGAAAGAGGGALMALHEDFIYSTIPIGAGLGALVGWAIDIMIKEREVLYRAPPQ